ncbi:MAG: NAD(P)(+) transhydrogenase (Re/Si-specific) subunit beta [Candidatus Omnitrophota bacterium]
MNLNIIISFAYILAAVLFALGLKMMNSPVSARRGNRLSAFGMLIAILATCLVKGLSFLWIIIGLLIGSVLGAFSAQHVAMTAMPQMVALLNGFGGLASLLVAWASYHYRLDANTFKAVSILLSTLIGGVTFTGSVVAWGKLQGVIPSRPILFHYQKIFNATLLVIILILGIIYCIDPLVFYPFYIFIIIFALVLGILVVLPIGGADMPVIISLLNSYSGMAACATGFVIMNNMLIVAGSLVGASGIILTNIMCKAMNRSLVNVLFSGFGAQVTQNPQEAKGKARPINTRNAYYLLEAARSVVFIPGYGLAAAQAQHVLRELAQLLEKNGTDVRYAIHPVAGRMPGHMNVLLAEANISYDQLVEMDQINPMMNQMDVAVVIGANDVVNPAARNDPQSPIYGMPIIDADKAKAVFVLKRSMATGFAGIPNDLFYFENTRMLFGDAKQSLSELVSEFKEGLK